MITRTRTTRLSVILTTALAVLGISTLASAQTAPQTCLAQQLNASGRICKALARCYARAMQSGDALDPACLSTAARRLGTIMTEVEDLALGACLTERTAPSVAATIGSGLDPMATALTLSGGHCAGKKMGYLGKECAGYFRCYAVGAAGSSSVDPTCLAVHQGKLLKTFDKAERKGNCVVTGDRTTLQAMVASLVDEVFVILRGTGTTTTTTTTATTSTSTLP